MESVCSFVARFQATFFFLVLPVLRGHFFARHAVSRAFPIVRVWSGTEKNSCWVFFFHLSVCGCEVLSCSVSTSFQMHPACFCVAGCCFDFLFRYGFGHGCTSKEGIKIRLCCVLPHMCYVVDWCCVGTNLVHNTGFLTISHAVCLVGTQNTSV